MTPIAVRAASALIAAYPYDFRARFGLAMADDLRSAAADHRGSGRFTVARFTVVELAGLACGCVREWLAKRSAEPSYRGRRLPDLRMMRPPGVGKADWFHG